MPFSDAGDSAASSPVETHNNLFSEPDDYFPPTPPPTTQTYTLISPSTAPNSTTNNRKITLHLVGYSPTEAHHLWNGSRVITEYLETHPEEVRGKTVLELGAGAGLPSLVSAVLGARRAVMTDYPDVEIVQTMWRNIDECELIPRHQKKNGVRSSGEGGGVFTTAAPAPFTRRENGDAATATPSSSSSLSSSAAADGEEGEEDQNLILAKGYVWGADPAPLLAALPAHSPNSKQSSSSSSAAAAKFDVLILADLLFRHSEHGHLLDTIRDTMSPNGGKSFVFFTSYRPWLQHKDLAFFDLARERGFVVEKLLERNMDKPMFENDPGDEEVRKTCTGWVVRWPDHEAS